MAGDINKAYTLIIQACNDPNIGYSQSARRTISLGVSYHTFCDCSSIESWALTLSGFFENNPWFATGNQISQLKRIGFHEVPVGGNWNKGDILWRPGHTEMVYEGRVTMGAHTDGIAFPKQVSINEFASRPSEWVSCWRYQDGASGNVPVLNISIYVVAAIVGNWSRESNVNPGIWEGLTAGSGGYGLGQWTGERRENLFTYLNDHGYSQDSGDGQIMFFYEENDWASTASSPLPFENLEAFLTSDSTDIPALTETFMRAWERPGVPALEDRIAFAVKAYSYILEHSGDTVEWITGNRYLSEEEQLNNAVKCYQLLALGLNPDGGQGWSSLLRYGAARELYRRRYIWR